MAALLSGGEGVCFFGLVLSFRPATPRGSLPRRGAPTSERRDPHDPPALWCLLPRQLSAGSARRSSLSSWFRFVARIPSPSPSPLSRPFPPCKRYSFRPVNRPRRRVASVGGHGELIFGGISWRVNASGCPASSAAAAGCFCQVRSRCTVTKTGEPLSTEQQRSSHRRLLASKGRARASGHAPCV